MRGAASSQHDLGPGIREARILSSPPDTLVGENNVVTWKWSRHRKVVNVLLEVFDKEGEEDGRGGCGRGTLLEMQVEAVECPCRNGGNCSEVTAVLEERQDFHCACPVTYTGACSKKKEMENPHPK